MEIATIELTNELNERMIALNKLNPNVTQIPDTGVSEYLAQPFRVFAMNDSDWWMARSLSEATRDYADMIELPIDELEEAGELTEAEMESHIYHDEEENSEGLVFGVKRTFAEELKRRIERDPVSQVFASSEY